MPKPVISNVQVPGSGTAGAPDIGMIGDRMDGRAATGDPPPPRPPVDRPRGVDASGAGMIPSPRRTGGTTVNSAGSAMLSAMAPSDVPGAGMQFTATGEAGFGDFENARAGAGAIWVRACCTAGRGRSTDRTFCTAGTIAAPTDPAHTHINNFDPITDTATPPRNHRHDCGYGGGTSLMQGGGGN